jgi:putative ABC transport system ATP-binding protein
MKQLIKLKNITKNYKSGSGDEYKVLKSIDLEINQGEFVAIMGPSGSGKSTTMHIIGCLDVPTDGDYFLEGQNVAHLSDEELAKVRNEKIGFIFQSFNLLPRMSVLENVLLPFEYTESTEKRKHSRDVAIETLKKVGLGEKMNNMSNQLSGGQIQRTAIARCLAMNPPIILADEPTGNLDSKTGHEIMDLLKTLNKEGNTIILVTHEDDIAAFAKRIVTLKDGVIISDKLN